MDDLSKVISETVRTDWDENDSVQRFDMAAQAWAVYCLRTMTGATLRAGLEISRSMADFINETVGVDALCALRESLYRPEEPTEHCPSKEAHQGLL